MSHNVHTDIVNFIARKLFNYYNGELKDSYFLSPEMYICGDWNHQYNDGIQYPLKELISPTGWKYIPFPRISSCLIEEKYPDINGDVWIKDHHMIYLVNESPYSNVGEYNISIISLSKDSIELFLVDHNIKKEIEQNAIVYSWW